MLSRMTKQWFYFGLMLAALGCGDDNTETGGSGGTATGTAGNGGAMGGAGGQGGTGGGPTTPFGVTVIDFTNSMPVDAAGVVARLDDGSVVEGVTDTSGTATLMLPDGRSWETALAHKNGYSHVA